MTRRFQFSLRALLVATAIVAALAAYQTKKARDQKEIVTLLSAKGCMVAYRHQELTPQERYHFVDPPAPKWLRGYLGDDYFRTPVAAWIHSESFTDEDLDLLASFPGLGYVMVSAKSSKVTDGAIQRFRMRRRSCYVDQTSGNARIGVLPSLIHPDVGIVGAPHP